MAAAVGDPFEPFTVVIKNHYDPVYSLRLTIDSADTTVGNLKGLIEAQHKGHPSVQIQMLVFRGKLLDSQTRLLTLSQSAALDSMCIHMTLRGGNTTALDLGLATKSPEPPVPIPESLDAAALGIDATPLHDDSHGSDGEEKRSADPRIHSATSSASIPASTSLLAPPTTPKPIKSTKSTKPRLPTPDSIIRQHSDPTHPRAAGRGSPPYHPMGPPMMSPYGPYPHSPYAATIPNPYYVPTVPPPPPHSSQSYGAVPTLVQQSSTPNPATPQRPYPMPYGYPPSMHYPAPYPYGPPMSPYGSPYRPPMSPYPYPVPPSPYAVPSPQRMNPTVSTITPRPRRSAPKMPKFGELKRSKSDSAKPQSEQPLVDHTEHTETEETKGDDPPAERPDIAAIGGYGMRRRNNGNGPRIGNQRRNVDNALNAADVPAENEQNDRNEHNEAEAPDAGNAAANDRGFGAFVIWLVGALNVNILIRLGLFMWFIGSNLSTYRYAMVCGVVAIYYLHQIGLLRYLFGNIPFAIGARNANANNAPQHRDPNASESGHEEVAPPQPLSYVELIQRALVGFALSLWPTWDHRQMYPAEPVRG